MCIIDLMMTLKGRNIMSRVGGFCLTCKTGFGLNYWIYCPYKFTQIGTTGNYSPVAILHTFQFNVAHALGFSLSTSPLLVKDLDTGVITVSLNHTLQILHIKPSLLRSTLHNPRRGLTENYSRTTLKRASVSPINP
jgi:hypothetical protein